jgi:hypothetical protein
MGLQEAEYLAEDSIPIILSLWLNSSSAGLPSRLLMMPSRCSSSSTAGLPSLLLVLLELKFMPPILLTLQSLWMRFLGLFELRLRQLSKHSAQDGFPKRSNMGDSPMFFEQFEHLKHRLCQYFSAASTNPPSDRRIKTGREHA